MHPPPAPGPVCRSGSMVPPGGPSHKGKTATTPLAPWLHPNHRFRNQWDIMRTEGTFPEWDCAIEQGRFIDPDRARGARCEAADFHTHPCA